jgi:putative inorganic carbon (HCO3(-)) transporter
VETTITITHQQPWFRNIIFYTGAIAIIILSRLIMAFLPVTTALSLILATQMVLFVLLFRRPVWAMAALLVGQFTASGYMLPVAGGTIMSVRFLWTIMAILLLIPLLKLRGGIKLGSKSRNILIPTIIFFVLATVANIVSLDMSSTLQYLRTGITALAIVFFLPALVKNEKDLKLLTVAIFITCFISAVAAVMQHYQFLGLPAYTLYGGMVHKNRTPGLAEGAVHLSYILPMIILPMLAMILLKGVSRNMRIILPVLALVILAALYFTYTRSGMYALAPGILVMIILLKGTMRKNLLLIFLILGAMFLLYINITGNRYSQGFSDEQSAAGRLVLWQAGVKIALAHPVFGIGQGQFMIISEGYSSEVAGSAAASASVFLGTQQNHNDFIRVWDSFGTPALLVFLWIFFNTFRNLLSAYRRLPTPFLKALALGCIGAQMAYVVSAFTHNVMDSVPLFWILAGFSLALVKLAPKPKPVAIVESPINVPVISPLPDGSSPSS